MCMRVCELFLCSHRSSPSSLDSELRPSHAQHAASSPLSRRCSANTCLSPTSPPCPPSHRNTENQQEGGFCPRCTGAWG